MNAAIIILIVLATLVLLFGGAYLFMASPGRVKEADHGWFTSTDFAHRGLYTADQTVPENSLAAFARAVEAGYGIELDVELTADDVLVVFHDDSLERMTGKRGEAWESTYEELQQLSLAGGSGKIPLFADVLRLVGGRVPLVVEIKSTTRLEKICSMTYELLRRYSGHYCMESFNPFMVAWFKKHAPEVLRGQLSMRYQNEKSVTGLQKFVLENMLLNFVARPQFISYRYEDCDMLSYRLCRSLGALTVAWTIRSTDACARAKKFFDTVIFEHFTPEKKWRPQG